MDKYIAKQIILAQIASGGGKGQDDVLARVSSIIPTIRISKKATDLLYKSFSGLFRYLNSNLIISIHLRADFKKMIPNIALIHVQGVPRPNDLKKSC